VIRAGGAPFFSPGYDAATVGAVGGAVVTGSGVAAAPPFPPPSFLSLYRREVSPASDSHGSPPDLAGRSRTFPLFFFLLPLPCCSSGGWAEAEDRGTGWIAGWPRHLFFLSSVPFFCASRTTGSCIYERTHGTVRDARKLGSFFFLFSPPCSPPDLTASRALTDHVACAPDGTCFFHSSPPFLTSPPVGNAARDRGAVRTLRCGARRRISLFFLSFFFLFPPFSPLLLFPAPCMQGDY